LVGLNLLALNGLAAPLRGVRIDLTAQGEYSVSPVTRRLLDGLDEPLLIRGYFSSKTHPLLTPLVPRIRDLIEEYGALGGERVRAEFLDPTSDPEIEKEANQDYGIASIPFQFASRHEASVVNSYFDVLIRYGDQYETLSFQDLIEVEVRGMDVAVRLRNLEYDLTRSIQKVVYGFQSLESVLARLPQEAHFTAFITRESLPQGFEGLPEQIESVAKEIEERSGGRFHWEIVDPDAEGSAFDRRALYERYGFQPMALSLFSQQTFMMHLLLEVGEYRERIVPSDSQSEADIRNELVAALKRAGSGSLKTVGWAAAGGFGGLSFDTLRETLDQTYHVEDVDLASGRVPGQVDVLLVLDPRDQGEESRYAIDQFLMRGGSAIIATGSRSLEGGGRQGLAVSKHESGLDALLASYGVRVGSEVVLDQQNAAFPIPVERNLGGFTVREIQMLRYPAFVDVRPEQMDRDNPALAGLPGVVMHWASVVEAITPGPPEEDQEQDVEGDAEEGGSAEEAGEEVAAEAAQEPDEATAATVLLRSSEAAWLLEDYDAQPNFTFFPQLGWKSGEEMQSHSLAVSRVGPLASHYRDREAPEFDVEGGAGEDEPSEESDSEEDGDDEPAQRRGDVIETSPERTRLVVLGSASFVSDFVANLAQQQGSDSHLANLQLIQNLVDWCLEDIDLLKIRSRGRYARLLAPTTAGLRQAVEWGNYGLALVAVVAIGGATLRRRRQAQPMMLPARAAAGEDGTGTGPPSAKGRS
jgi:ABC-2 type transport system permease protein